MLTKELKIAYQEYNSVEEMEEMDRKLYLEAIDATKSSYAPYSKFNVGAAVLMDNGSIVKGSNQENAAYPSGLCAERTAIFAAHAQYPDANIKTLAVTASVDGVLLKEAVAPCGACRQVMAESQRRSGSSIRIIFGGSNKILIFNSVDDLLPFIFNSI